MLYNSIGFTRGGKNKIALKCKEKLLTISPKNVILRKWEGIILASPTDLNCEDVANCFELLQVALIEIN